MIERQHWIAHKFNLGINVGWIHNILSRIEDTEIRLLHHVKNLSDEQLSRKTKDQWSIKEHIGHLIDLEELWLDRFDQFEKQLPELIAADMSNQKTKDSNHNEQGIDELINNFKNFRQILLDKVLQFGEQTQNHQAFHPRIKEMMRPVDLLFFLAEHDNHHLTTIKALIHDFRSENLLKNTGRKFVLTQSLDDLKTNEHRIILLFNNRKLPKVEWTHEAHLIVSLWYCINYKPEEALKLLRAKITLYNQTVGTPNTDEEGYHETVTRFWIWQTNHFIQESESNNFADMCTSFIFSKQGHKEAPLQYYSKELLFSKTARNVWVRPDLKEMDIGKNRYMIIEKYRPGKVRAIYARFAEKGRMLPRGVKYVNSWIDKDVQTCYQLMEAKTEEKLKEWFSQWEDLVDFEVVPVISSQEANTTIDDKL
ncbi:MAG: DinB family protein [Flavobacteriales bacterium]